MNNFTLSNAVVGTTPRYLTTESGLRICSFRVAEIDDSDHTNWYTVTFTNNIAENAKTFVEKGMHLDIFGSIKVRDWDNGTMQGTSVEVNGTSITLPDGMLIMTGTDVLTKVRKHVCDCDNCDLP